MTPAEKNQSGVTEKNLQTVKSNTEAREWWLFLHATSV